MAKKTTKKALVSGASQAFHDSVQKERKQRLSTKKPVKVPAGIYFKGVPGNISVHIHASNGNKIAVLKGYNNRQNAQKSLRALHSALSAAMPGLAWGSAYKVVDLVKPRKPALKTKN